MTYPRLGGFQQKWQGKRIAKVEAQQPMRINEQQIVDIRRIIVELLPDVLMIELFGSRTHDTRRGGDVDLYIEIPRPIPILFQADLLRRLEQALGLPVDLIIHDPRTPPHPIAALARETGIPLT